MKFAPERENPVQVQIIDIAIAGVLGVVPLTSAFCCQNAMLAGTDSVSHSQYGICSPYGGSFCTVMAADRAKHAISIFLFWLPHVAMRRTVPSEDRPTGSIRWPVLPRPNACIPLLSAEG